MILETILNLAPIGVIQGLILSLIALGVYIPFRLLDFPDLSSEGSYPLAGACTAALLSMGFDPLSSVILSGIAGGLLGIGTALIHIKLRVNTLLAGILMSTIAYSVNLRIMGKPNMALFKFDTLFSFIPDTELAQIGFMAILVGFILLLCLNFLKTEIGLAFRAVGANQHFAQKQSINLNLYIISGLFAGNFFCAIAGSLMVQLQSYADINMGVGIVIHALAALMIGESLIRSKQMSYLLVAPICGALIYQQIQGVALSIGLAPSDLKMLTAVIVLSVIALNKRRIVCCK